MTLEPNNSTFTNEPTINRASIARIEPSGRPIPLREERFLLRNRRAEHDGMRTRTIANSPISVQKGCVELQFCLLRVCGINEHIVLLLPQPGVWKYMGLTRDKRQYSGCSDLQRIVYGTVQAPMAKPTDAPDWHSGGSLLEQRPCRPDPCQGHPSLVSSDAPVATNSALENKRYPLGSCPAFNGKVNMLQIRTMHAQSITALLPRHELIV